MSKSVRRLVDYFLVVTFEQQQLDSNPSSDSITPSNIPEFQPIIAARYPLEDHVGTPLHESVTCFCHPQGNVRLRKVPPNLPKVHYFVMTGARGGLMYGTCLTIYEPYKLPSEQPPESASASTSTAESAPTSTFYLPKCICLLSSFPYLIAFREYLIQLQRLISSGEMSIPVERYITNICYEVPAPPPGSLEVQTSILDSIITFWSLPYNLPIPWVSLPFSVLFECLNTDNILSIWLAIVLERQVLFTSTQLSLLTLCCEILISLLFPLKWSHAYIPVLPKFLIPILSAPMPFICGIHKENLPEALLNVSSECIIVDLDKNNINMGPMTPDIPCLPLDYEDALRYMLEKHAGRYFREARSLTKNENLFEKGVPLANDLKRIGQAVWESKLMLYDDASTLVFTPNAKSDYLNGSTGLGPEFVDSLHTNQSTGDDSSSSQAMKKQSNWDAVQESFLSFFICVLRNYREYMIYPSKARGSENVASYDGAGFLSKNFVKAERHDIRDFLNQFLGTQMWDEFVTKRLYGSSSPDVIFFDDAVNRFSKMSTASLFMGRRRFSMDKYLENSTTRQKSKYNWASLQHRAAAGLNLSPTEKVDEYLLQSARVRSRLKTLVSPEPVLSDFIHKDDQSEKSPSNQLYVFKDFPWQWDMALLGSPRPLPPAAFTEFDNQRENTVKFRRRTTTEEDYSVSIQDPTALAEIATFTLFFVSFTSVVGHLILVPSESVNGKHFPAPIPTIGDGHLKNNIPISSPRSTLEGMESSEVNTDSSMGEISTNLSDVQKDVHSSTNPVSPASPRYETSRMRFRHSRKYLEIEESKAKAKAALGLAFDILECMKMRCLKADPESYQFLMDACGKCGDTKRVSQLLVRMHEDGIVADSAVYSSLVTAFSSDTVLNTTAVGVDESSLPEWANGVSFTIDWNKLSLIRRPKEKLTKNSSGENLPKPRKNPTKMKSMLHILNKHQPDKNEDPVIVKRSVTDSVMRQIILGESVLEMVYPGVEINTDGEVCPRCNLIISDDDIIKGWSVNDSQDYTTKCHLCSQKFVPHFRVQTSSPSFRGSKGTGTPLFIQRLSPWVLGKELRTVINDNDGIDSLLDPKWREKESKNEVLWWNLILSFMRFRLPFPYLLQGSVEQSLLVPSPSDDI